MGLAQLRKATKIKDKELMLTLGWLAHEDKLVIVEDEDGKNLIVRSPKSVGVPTLPLK